MAKVSASLTGLPGRLQSPRPSRKLEGKWCSDLRVRLGRGDQRHVNVDVWDVGGRAQQGETRKGRTGGSVDVQYAQTCGLTCSCRLVRLIWPARGLQFFEKAHHHKERRHLRGRLRSHLVCELCNRLNNNVPGGFGKRVGVRGCFFAWRRAMRAASSPGCVANCNESGVRHGWRIRLGRQPERYEGF